AGGVAGFHDLAGKLRVHALERGVAALVEDPGEAHDRVHVVESALQGLLVVGIGDHHLERREHEEVFRARLAAGEHAHPQAPAHGLLRDGAADETGAADDANALDVHLWRFQGMLAATAGSAALPGTVPSSSRMPTVLPVRRCR